MINGLPVKETAERLALSAHRTHLTLSFPVESYPLGMVYAFHFGDLPFAGGEKLEHKEAW